MPTIKCTILDFLRSGLSTNVRATVFLGGPRRGEEIITDLIKSVDFEIGLLTTVDGKTYEFEGRQGTGSIGESGKLTRDE
jgi:hypothetical protein